MRKYTAAYSYSHRNFVIQNLKEGRIDTQFLAPICILKNILQRGTPTLLSKFLQSKIGSIHKSSSFEKPYPLIAKEPPNWQRIIRGDVKGNYFPAKKFFEEIIPRHLSDYQFIQQLLVPEMPLNLITMVDVDEFTGQQADFYLPQAYLILEIDGAGHDVKKDTLRDAYTAKYGIQTIRILATEIEKGGESLRVKIEEIRRYLGKAMEKQLLRRENDHTFISLQDLREAHNKQINFSDPNYQATAIIRFQILILELLEIGQIDFSGNWQFEILNTEGCEFADLALLDLCVWLEHLFKLHKIKWMPPTYTIQYVGSIDEFDYEPKVVKVDFSLSKRYTDEFQVHPEILFVRTDYLDEFRFFKKGNAVGELVFSSFQPYDNFNVSTTNSVKYQLQLGGADTDEKSLLFFLGNIFLQEAEDLHFNEGQLAIIANALNRNDTIGLLPTGSGKSVCYQLSSLLQPGISFVVCPIKSLMYDQVADLRSSCITRINQITSDDDGEDKERIQFDFAKGRYLFVFISPERFQIKTFRDYLSAVDRRFSIVYAVVDEVHCLSEWGHDFRTAYLKLSSTIQRFCKHSKFIGLTATASLNVLKDIQIEFGIRQENVKTPLNYSRRELDFEVIDDAQAKEERLKSLLRDLNDEQEIFTPNGADSRCGIVFTPTVNGKNGCYPLAKKLSSHFNADIRYYSGTVPKINNIPVLESV